MSVNDKKNLIDKLIEDARYLGDIRMLRDEQPVTEDLAKQVIERFQQFLVRVEKSAEWAARSMGVSASTLSQVVSGNYAGDAEKHLRNIDRWLEGQIMREAAPKPAGFVRTSVAEQIYAAAKVVIKTNAIAVVHGPNGCGKTMTLQAIRAETPGSLYVSVDSSGRRVRAVLDSLFKALRMSGLKLSTSQMFQQIATALRDTGRLIIIDEVHKLAGRQNDDALHVLRDLHDQTRCPMLWAGNGKIASYIRDNQSDGYDPLDQIFGRISVWLDLTEKAENAEGGGSTLCTVQDIQKFLAGSKIRLSPDATRYLAKLGSDASLGCYRAVKHLVMLAMIYAKDQLITADMLRAIQRERLGKRTAEAVDEKIGETRMAATA